LLLTKEKDGMGRSNLESGYGWRVIVPATSANLGCAFDCGGLAVKLYLKALFVPSNGTGLTLEYQGKTPEQVVAIVRRLAEGHDNILCTRVPDPTVEALIGAGVCARRRDGVKILGKGTLAAKLTFEVAAASKSAVARSGERKFLGFTISNDAEPIRQIAAKALQKFKERIREFTRRTRGEALSKIVEQTCQEFGVKYECHPTFWAGVVSHYRWLRRMGRPEEAAAPA